MGLTACVKGYINDDGTGLWSTALEELTDDESSCESPDTVAPTKHHRKCLDGDKPVLSAATKAANAALRRKQRKDREERLKNAHWAWRYHQSRHWAMRYARKCQTSFRGRSDRVTNTRPAIPKGATREEILRILHGSGYDFKTIESVSNFTYLVC
jgi:hypothetical protein